MSDQPGQKNFSLTPGVLSVWTRWCKRNNYQDRGVFFAGWRLLSEMSHEERKALFEETDAWVEKLIEIGEPPAEQLRGTARGDHVPLKENTAG